MSNIAASDNTSCIPEDEFCIWSKNDQKFLNKHQTYHKEMVNYIEKLKNEGQSDSIPVKPTSKLPISSKKSRKLIGEKLHEYLENKIFIVDFDAPDVPKEKTYKNLMSYLKKCVEHENTVNKKGLKFHHDNGTVLEEIFAKWKEEKVNRKMYLSWKEWLQENIGIGERDARKKREFGKIIKEYPRLYWLISLSMNFIN